MTGGLYVHIPFCEKSCSYCNYFSFRASDEYAERYRQALVAEIRARSTQAVIFDTIYFGGGNPARLSLKAMESVLEALRASYKVSNDLEITLEANPESLTRERLISFRNLGVSRVSLGIQSFNKTILKTLQRTGESDLSSVINEALRLFKNVNLDLMYAIPGQCLEDIQNDLENIPEGVTHVSYYSLCLEKGTLLYKKRLELSWPDEDKEIGMKKLIVSGLKKKHFRQYEISNYCLPGYESKHNLHYWKYEDYFGVGAGAASTYRGIRMENTTDMKRYFSGDWHENVEELTDSQIENEWIMMRFRLKEGISFSEYQDRFNRNFDEKYSAQLRRYQRFFSKRDQAVALNNKGLELYNEIVADFFS